MLGKRIGPHARAMAAFLHNEIGVSARKVPRAIEGLTGLGFTSAAFLEFEADLARQAKPLRQHWFPCGSVARSAGLPSDNPAGPVFNQPSGIG